MNKDFDLLHVRIVGFIGQHALHDPAAMAGELRRQLEKMASPGTRLMALSPLSGPTDLLFAREALALGWPLVVALTVPREAFGANFPPEARADFDHVLRQAAKVEALVLSGQGDATTRLGQKLVDESDVILAVAEEAGTRAAGDAAEVIAYATRRGRPVIRLWETAAGIEVREIKTEPGSPESGLSIGELQSLLGEPPPEPVIPEGLSKYFHACDKHATDTAPVVRRYVLNIVLANSIASMAGGVGSSFIHATIWGTILTVIKFLCIATGLGIFFELRQRQSRKRWLDLRLKAEVCRSAISTWHSPTAIEPLSADEAPELRPLLQALRYFHATHHRAAEISVDAFKAAYGKRLVDQYLYFQRQASSAIFFSSKLTPLTWALSGIALATSLLAVVFEVPYFARQHLLGTWTNFVLVFVPIVAPQMASCLLAWQSIEAVSRKRARFVEMQKAMHQALVDLIHCHSWEAAQHVAKKAEKHLLSEVLEWYAFVRYSS